MEFQDLVDSQIKDENLKAEIAALLKRKMAGEELKEEPRIEILNEFLERKIEFYKDYVEQIEPNEKPQTALLDELFKKTIYEVWK
jgi:predicted nucleotidyltransferase